MNTEQERTDFDSWLYLGQTEYEPDDLNKREFEIARFAFTEARAALQSQDREDEYPTRAAVEAVRLDDWENQEYPEHCRISCSDEHPINAEPNGHGCVRCNAILFAQHEFLLSHARRVEEDGE